MLILNANDVRQALPMQETIAATKQAYAALTAGRAHVPLRAQLPIPPEDATALFMPAYVQAEPENALTVKIVTLFPKNIPVGLPLIHAAVLVMDAKSGQMLALIEGSALTAIRTGAASGAATDLLAPPASRIAAIFGAGAQARTQLEAVCAVRPIQTAYIYDPDPEKTTAYIAEMCGKGAIPRDLRPAASPREAVATADIICCATTARAPVFSDADLKPGAHINGVGSYTPDMIEIPPETVARAEVFVGSKEAVMAEAGEILAAINRKMLFPAELTELGEVVLGTAPGRTSPEAITFFKSVGVAVQDAAAAQLALKNAQKMGLGQKVAW